MRNHTVDLLKAFASQTIVIHHLLLYTPMSKNLQAQWPGLLGFVADEGRYVVQIFLVIGAYLASQSLFKMLALQRKVSLLPLIKKRCLRLAKPFWVAIAVTVLFTWLAGKIALHDAISDLPSFVQLLAHVFLLHDIVGVEALSAGAWYVAIDLQLFALLVLMTRVSQKLGDEKFIQPSKLLLVLASAVAIASLCIWNRNSEHDEWAWYFFGSYGLGVFAYWLQRENQNKNRLLIGTVALAAVLGLALWIEWRERLLLTGFATLLLLYSHRIEVAVCVVTRGPIRWLGDISYSVFLIHYGVAVFASSVVIALGVEGLLPNVLAFVATWLASVAAGWFLYRKVEFSVHPCRSSESSALKEGGNNQSDPPRLEPTSEISTLGLIRVALAGTTTKHR